ncbi:hypothetical protein Poly51_45630 [Rubripirellula tenax]|uniref:Transposase n=1 Tax=Rubripirellula tenax TaxID=2528015 RepID=A0A5C6EI04_9BACT|nr:hypothetical protein Poly51_45630 [Rubripirellula tenax]
MKKRKRHSPEQIVKKLRDADAILAAGKTVGEVLQSLEVSEATLSRWRTSVTNRNNGTERDWRRQIRFSPEKYLHRVFGCE